MLYIHTVMKAMIAYLSIAGIRFSPDELTSVSSIQGELVMKEWPGHDTFHSPIRLARLRSRRGHALRPELLPPLFGAQVLRITGTQLLICGIENFVGKQQIREAAQTWMAKLS